MLIEEAGNLDLGPGCRVIAPGGPRGLNPGRPASYINLCGPPSKSWPIYGHSDLLERERKRENPKLAKDLIRSGKKGQKNE